MHTSSAALVWPQQNKSAQQRRVPLYVQLVLYPRLDFIRARGARGRCNHGVGGSHRSLVERGHTVGVGAMGRGGVVGRIGGASTDAALRVTRVARRERTAYCTACSKGAHVRYASFDASCSAPCQATVACIRHPRGVCSPACVVLITAYYCDHDKQLDMVNWKKHRVHACKITGTKI